MGNARGVIRGSLGGGRSAAWSAEGRGDGIFGSGAMSARPFRSLDPFSCRHGATRNRIRHRFRRSGFGRPPRPIISTARRSAKISSGCRARAVK